jgi:hypothetical protein
MVTTSTFVIVYSCAGDGSSIDMPTPGDWRRRSVFELTDLGITAFLLWVSD